jgi:hypothetical protein
VTPQAPAKPRGRGRPSRLPRDVLARVVLLRREDWTLKAISDLLNAEGVPTPSGGTRWCPSHVSNLLYSRAAEEFEDDHDLAL